MTIEPMAPDDVQALLELACRYGGRVWQIVGGDSGVAARDARGVAGFALVRQAPFGLVVDEMWGFPTARGRRAIAMLQAWAERQATPLGRIGGVVECRNAAMVQSMARRGYEVVAHVYAKELTP